MATFIQFQLPSTRDVIILCAFLFLLQAARIISQRILKVGSLGQVFIGALFGAPLANLIPMRLQLTCVDIGYIGLILLVFEGALATNLNLLVHHLALSIVLATTGVVVPVGASFLFLRNIGYSNMQAFAAGAALSATSLGTTITILKNSDARAQNKREMGIFATAISTVLLSVAIIDDVVGLIMASIIISVENDPGHRQSLGWIIGRPVLSSVGLAMIIFVLAKILERLPLERLWEPEIVRHYERRINITVMLCILTGICSAAAYSGSSIIYGAFLAGLFLGHIGSGQNNRTDLGEPSTDQREDHGQHPPNFFNVHQRALSKTQELILSPFFFASIGFAIPFRDLWKPTVVWQGLLYAVLMIVAKMVVGAWIPLWKPMGRLFHSRRKSSSADVECAEKQSTKSTGNRGMLIPGAFIGVGLIARGELGLLICQLAYDGGRGPFNDDLFAITLWSLVVTTIAGPLLVSLVLRRGREKILAGPWGRDEEHS